MKRKRTERQDRDRNGSDAHKRPRISNAKPEQLSEASIQNLLPNRYYRHVYSLRAFLLEWLPCTSRIRRKRLKHFDADHPQHFGFLTEILVGFSGRPSPETENARRNGLAVFTQTQRLTRGDSYTHRKCDLSEILDFAIWTLFQRDAGANKAPCHLLCHGYQTSTSVRDPECLQILQLPGIVQKTRNAHVDTFKQAPWTIIADILGADAETIMLTLFLDCGIFQQLRSGQLNLQQICGGPITRLMPLSMIGPNHGAALKQQAGKMDAKPGSITFVRSRMLYARPALNSRGEVQLGLKHIHILNRCSDLTNAAHDIRVMQYIFPRHFGLHNVFTCKPDPSETVQPLKDYTIREQEITSCDQRQLKKVPRCLKGRVITLVRKLRKNHSRCSYTQLLRHYCPILDPKHENLYSGSYYGHKPSLASPQLNTQLLLQTNPSDAQETNDAKYETSLIPYATSTIQVSAFCQAVLSKLLPHDVLGVGELGRQNWTSLFCSIDQFVKMRRFESTTLHAVCQGLKLSCIDWLRPPRIRSVDKMSRSDYDRRLDILYELIYYIFDSILTPLIRSNFYVTETGIHRYRIFYFRHDIWKKMVEPSLASMKLSTFAPLKSHQLKHTLAANSLGSSQMRLLPKQNGIRPITNLKRRSVTTIKGKPLLSASINSRLAPVFSILNLERSRQPERLASAMFSVGEMQRKLRDFKIRQHKPNTKSFFFVKADIRSCFDTIPQEKLILLMREILTEGQYQVTKHVEMKHTANSSRCPTRPAQRLIHRAIGMGESAFFDQKVAACLASRKRKHIFIGTDQERTMSAAQVHSMLSDHLRQNIVRIGRRHFRQTEGIPQGSVLSSLLCNFFYGDFERERLDFLDPSVSLLLRLIDDFLLITTSEEQARKFVQALYQGDGEYGISANADKSLVNFEISVDGHKIPRLISGTHFPYCGMIIDSQNLQIFKDRQVRDLHVENGLTVGRAGRIGAILRSRLVASLKRQMHMMLFDEVLSCRGQILSSIFECFIESGMKLHRYVRSLKAPNRPSQAYLVEVCNQLINQGFKTIQGNQRQNTDPVTRTQTAWLAATALIEVLTQKQSGYAEVLHWLLDQQNTARASMNMTIWHRREFVNNSMKSFVQYVY